MHTHTLIRLLPLTRNNWERALELQLDDSQVDFMPGVLHSIAQSRFEQSDLYGVYLDKLMIGFICVCWFNNMPWITRILIDKNFQGQGHGRATLQSLLQKLLARPGVDEIRTTVALKNAGAEYLFTKAGFERTGELDGRELVLAYRKPERY